MKPHNFTLVTCLVILIAGALPSVDDSVKAGPDALSAPSPQELVDAVNSLRESRGSPSYAANSILMGTAQAQADYMARTGQVTHYGPDGSRPFQRALAAGYPVAGDLSLGGWFSENIMGGKGLSAQNVIEKWLGDAPHSLTMLSPDLFDIGAGVAADGNYYYFVIDCGQAGNSAIPPKPTVGTEIIPDSVTAVGAVGATTETPAATAVVVVISTPDGKGNIYHVVEAGQTLWDISVAYQTSVDQIKRLNGLSSNVIFAGQRLLIRRAGTPTPPPMTSTPTRILSTPLPLPTLAVVTSAPSAVASQIPLAQASDPLSAAGIIAAITLVALVAAALLARAARARDI